MPVSNARFGKGDVYLRYGQEQALFRWERASRRCFRKFFGESAEAEISWDDRLFNEAVRFGEEIDASAYRRG